jgi:hypothetical protein
MKWYFWVVLSLIDAILVLFAVKASRRRHFLLADKVGGCRIVDFCKFVFSPSLLSLIGRNVLKLPLSAVC